MTNYKNGRIYKILNTIDDNVYVGSTTEALCKRMWKHKWDVKNNRFITRPLYVKAKEYGFENFYIELIENYPCECKEELVAREGYWIRQIGTLNAIVAGRTPKEYYEENKQQLQTKSNEYYYANREEQLRKSSEWRKLNKDLIKQTMKTYRENNQEKLFNYRESAKEYRAQKITCNICSTCVSRGNMSTHQKTKKCKSSIKPDVNE